MEKVFAVILLGAVSTPFAGMFMGIMGILAMPEAVAVMLSGLGVAAITCGLMDKYL